MKQPFRYREQAEQQEEKLSGWQLDATDFCVLSIQIHHMARTDHCKYLKIPHCQPRGGVDSPAPDKKPENILVPKKLLIILTVAGSQKMN